MRVTKSGAYQSSYPAANAYAPAGAQTAEKAGMGKTAPADAQPARISPADAKAAYTDKIRPQTSAMDTVELSRAFRRPAEREDGRTVDHGQRIRTLLEALCRRYPGVQLQAGVHADENSLRDLAAGLGEGSHLLLTDEFLERMGGSEEEFLACRDVLSEMMEQLSARESWIRGSGVLLEKDRAVSWLVPNPKKDLVRLLEEKQKKAGEAEELLRKQERAKEESRLKVHPSSYNTAASYARLARAGSRFAVQQVMSEARRSIGSLRLVTCYGDEKERSKAGKAIRSMQKLLLRARRKMNRIQEETLLEIRKKRAKERQEEERVMQMKLELEKKRTRRHSADGAIALEGRLDDSALEWNKRCHPDKEWESAVGAGVIPGGGPGAGGADPAGGTAGAAGGGSFTADQVVISSAVAF